MSFVFVTRSIFSALKGELFSIYQDGEHLSTSLGPIATDEDKHIDELYVAPNMTLVDHEIASDDGTHVKKAIKACLKTETKGST